MESTRINAQVIHELYDAYVTGNLAAFDVYTEDSVWVEVGRNERTGVYRGKQAILEHGMQLAVLTDGTIATKVEEILPGDNHVAVLERATAKRNGRELDMDCCSMYTLRDGKIAELHVLPYDAARWDEFWS
jgi:ketosteroid isomerase-like protein